MKTFQLGAVFLYRMLNQKPYAQYLAEEVTHLALPDYTALQKITPLTPPIGDIVLLHGMNTLGSRDPRIIKLARVIASLGFTVWLPHFNEIANHEIHRDITSRLNTMLLCLKTYIAGPLAIMAPSYLGSIALHLAGNPREYVTIDTLCCIGIFANFDRFMLKVCIGEHTDPYGRAITLKNLLLTQNRLSPGIHQSLEQIFQNLHDRQNHLTNINIGHLSLDEQEALRPLLQTDQWQPILEPLKQFGLLLENSPEHLSNTSTKLAFIHGAKDTLAPSHEIKPLVAYLPADQWRMSITGLMDHSAFLYKIHQLPTLFSLVNTFGFFFNQAMVH